MASGEEGGQASLPGHSLSFPAMANFAIQVNAAPDTAQNKKGRPNMAVTSMTTAATAAPTTRSQALSAGSVGEYGGGAWSCCCRFVAMSCMLVGSTTSFGRKRYILVEEELDMMVLQKKKRRTRMHCLCSWRG